MTEGLMRKEYPFLKETVFTGRLSDGCQVYLIPRAGFREVCGMVSVGFGAIDSKCDGTEVDKLVNLPLGIAHFLEHRLFEKEELGEMSHLFSEKGADVNAYTGFTHTNYYFSASQNVLENTLLLRQLICQPYFTDETVEREKSIIAQEIDLYLDDADYRLYASVLENLYPDTPLAYDIAGTKESIGRVTKEDLYAATAAGYGGCNQSLVVIGDFEVSDLWEKLTSVTPSSLLENGKKRERERLLHLPVISRQQLEMEVASPKVAIGFRGNDWQRVQEKSLYRYRLELSFFFQLLFGWMSQFYQELYETHLVEGSLDIQVEVEDSYHHVIVSADTEKPEMLLEKLTIRLQKVDNDDMTVEHFDLLKKELYGDFLHQLQSVSWVAGQFLQDVSAEQTMFDLPVLLEEMTFDEVLKTGCGFMEMCEGTESIIFPKNSF